LPCKPLAVSLGILIRIMAEIGIDKNQGVKHSNRDFCKIQFQTHSSMFFRVFQRIDQLPILKSQNVAANQTFLFFSFSSSPSSYSSSSAL
jgi:hypothetical protein